MKSVSIFGSTGTIGRKAADIAFANGFEILALSCHDNHKLIIEQAKKYCPKYVCVCNKDAFKIAKSELSYYNIEVLPGDELCNITSLAVDCCIMAIAGNAGVLPTFSTIGRAKRLAIATKEAIISGGFLLMDLARQNGTEIIPIDSEHNAVFQCLLGEENDEINEIILTASGGPFLDFDENELENITPEQAMAHPNWEMGKKISIDSATMINKALEIVEAHYLFNITIEKIKYLLHPNSIIHAIVGFTDGSFKTVMSSPNMTIPISFALNYPDRKPCVAQSLNFTEIGQLAFRKPKPWQKRNIELAYQAVEEKKVIAFNRANEIAIANFLNRKIKFPEIYTKITKTLANSESENIKSLQEVVEKCVE
ncbi:1-deoxy-D-xylulose 5-phosphate reductoisomerase [Alphaproteobacteria bacterium]|nr:1-deoxy-D-xylulose 5-phosphate reductoisomerase [Alphaproteobacteria bacterium]